MAPPLGPSIPTLVEPKSTKDILKYSVYFIAMTNLGERVMLPEFGTDLPGILFEQNDVGTIMAIKQQIQDAIGRWDDRIEFLDCQLEPDGNYLNVRIVYRDASDTSTEEAQIAEFSLSDLYAGA